MFPGMLQTAPLSFITPTINPSPKTIRKARWTPAEDNLLRKAVEELGTSNWSRIAERVQTRDGKQCRERFKLNFEPNINCLPWTKEEDDLLIMKQGEFGNSWSKISKFFPNRSNTNIKNRWKYLKKHSLLPIQIQKPTNQPQSVVLVNMSDDEFDVFDFDPFFGIDAVENIFM